jgi:hypothetical protein
VPAKTVYPNFRLLAATLAAGNMFILSVLQCPTKQPAEHICFCGLNGETPVNDRERFMQSPRPLRGQHINSYSRDIHRRFRPIKSSL